MYFCQIVDAGYLWRLLGRPDFLHPNFAMRFTRGTVHSDTVDCFDCKQTALNAAVINIKTSFRDFTQDLMEKVPSTHRFHVAKVEFVEENENKFDQDPKRHESVDTVSNGLTMDSADATFSLPNDTYGANQNSYTGYGTNLKTFGKDTTEAIPHVDHYRNLLSATSPLKSRPTLAELHAEKVKKRTVSLFNRSKIFSQHKRLGQDLQHSQDTLYGYILKCNILTCFRMT